MSLSARTSRTFGRDNNTIEVSTISAVRALFENKEGLLAEEVARTHPRRERGKVAKISLKQKPSV